MILFITSPVFLKRKVNVRGRMDVVPCSCFWCMRIFSLDNADRLHLPDVSLMIEMIGPRQC